MALFRIHRKEWEKGARPLPTAPTKPSNAQASSSSHNSRKRPHEGDVSRDDVGSDDEEEIDGDEAAVTPASKRSGKSKGKSKAHDAFPGGGRRGVSSGLSTVVKRVGASGKGDDGQARSKGKSKTKEKWWKELGGGGSKGSLRLKAG